jgi:hypothetical protein
MPRAFPEVLEFPAQADLRFMASFLRLAVVGLAVLSYAWLTAVTPGGEKRYERFVRTYLSNRIEVSR